MDQLQDQLQEENQATQARELAKARNVVTTGRGLVEYEERLLIDRDELKSKIILDLGAGVAVFPLELADYFQESAHKPQIVAYDIAYDFQSKGAGKALLDKKILALRQKHPDCISIVPGLFSDLSFPDKTFDYIFSLYAFPLHIRGEEFFEKGLIELIRVLKTGGVAKLAPLEYNSGQIDDTGKEKYLSFWYNQDHFNQILAKISQSHPDVKFSTFKSKNNYGLEIKKQFA